MSDPIWTSGVMTSRLKNTALNAVHPNRLIQVYRLGSTAVDTKVFYSTVVKPLEIFPCIIIKSQESADVGTRLLGSLSLCLTWNKVVVDVTSTALCERGVQWLLWEPVLLDPMLYDALALSTTKGERYRKGLGTIGSTSTQLIWP